MRALLGRVDARRVCPDPGLAAALSLVADVHHLNGGRQVTLRSVFRLQVGEREVLVTIRMYALMDGRFMGGT